VYFTPPLTEFPLELGIGARGQKTRLIGRATGLKKFDDIFSRVNIIHQRDGQTDRQTDTRRQQRPCLRTASRGNESRARQLPGSGFSARQATYVFTDQRYRSNQIQYHVYFAECRRIAKTKIYSIPVCTVIMRPSSLGGGRILRRTLSVRLSVCLSVRPSRYRM